MVEPDGAVRGDDGLARCPWGADGGLLGDYHDQEWGVPVVGEQAYFERLSLEGFQAGLSWRTILAKRDRFREVFHGFDVDRVAAMTDADLEVLMTDPGIVRNRAKIEATRRNARATVALRSDPALPDGLVTVIESHRPAEDPRPRVPAEVPATSPESAALSKDLRRRGLAFVGPTTAHALMEALGLTDSHLVTCFRRGIAR